jgi:8-oxo-dGTP pyrophosphatase MutT (NUDIX family)
VDRHLTVSGFVVHKGRVALHWHRKNAMWLPAGGHLEPGEDPVSATLREVREEFDIEAEIIAAGPRVSYEGGPAQIAPPYTILICHPEPGHEHVDMVYFCRALSGYPGRSHDPGNPIIWFDLPQLERGSAPYRGLDVPFPPDVRALGIEAIRLAETSEAIALASGKP